MVAYTQGQMACTQFVVVLEVLVHKLTMQLAWLVLVEVVLAV